mmetsp:Transcript_39281/g.63717  ORF Transcript_39281/g.63717 Transcript_39281/m.63717 type:complete len:324 (+) Transcript_39281:30-1001(+)
MDAEHSKSTTSDWASEFANFRPPPPPAAQSLQLPTSPSILRVNQLDAAQLDLELTSLLKTQFLKAFALFKPGLIDRIQPELEALLHFLVYRFTIYNGKPLPGIKLQNLRYRDERQGDADLPLGRAQRVLYGVLVIGGRWLWSRLNVVSTNHGWGDRPENDWRRRAWVALHHFETLYKVASIINLVLFLYNGRFRSIVDRFLRMRLVYSNPRLTRRVNFEYMNRQLVWKEFTELLLFIMPLINLEKLKGSLLRRFRPVNTEHDAQLAPSICAICRADPINAPYQSNCGHSFCYYCLKSSCMADSRYRCPRCDVLVTGMTRLATG